MKAQGLIFLRPILSGEMTEFILGKYAMTNLLTPAIVLLLFSYPLSTVVLLQLDMRTATNSAIVKGVVVAIFLAALIFQKRSLQGVRVAAPLLILFAVYGIRLIYDVLLLDIVYVFQSKFYTLSYFFGLTLLPTVAAALCLPHESVERLHKWMFASAIITNVMLLYFFSMDGPIDNTAFSGRFEIEGELEGTTVLNPIMVGLMGAVLIAFTMGRLAVIASASPFQQGYHGALIVLGGANLLLGASRGPAVAFTAIFLITLYFLARSHLTTTGLRFRRNLWLFAILLLGALSYLVMLDSLSIQLFDRLALMFDDQAGRPIEERDFIYAEAWNDFLSSPLVGFSYMTTTGYSPHNIILGTLMATGLVGGVFLLFALFRAMRGTLNMLRGSAGPWGFSIALAAICFFVLGMTSGSVDRFPEFWIFFTIVTIFGNPQKIMQRPVVRLRRPPVWQQAVQR